MLENKIKAFQGTRGKWKGNPVTLELVEGAKPFYSKPYKIPKAYEKTTKKEVDRLVQIGLLN